jgi:hypothetical protein
MPGEKNEGWGAGKKSDETLQGSSCRIAGNNVVFFIYNCKMHRQDNEKGDPGGFVEKSANEDIYK